MSILDISRTLKYDFHYNYVKKKYGSSAAWPKAGDRAKLLFTDTDSLLYEIAIENFYKDICGDVEDKLDTSTHPEDRVSGIPNGRNKKVVGMMKDEADGKADSTAKKYRKEILGLYSGVRVVPPLPVAPVIANILREYFSTISVF